MARNSKTPLFTYEVVAVGDEMVVGTFRARDVAEAIAVFEGQETQDEFAWLGVSVSFRRTTK